MCSFLLKSEIAFQEEAAHEIHIGHIAGDTTFPNLEAERNAGAVCPAARTGLHPAPDTELTRKQLYVSRGSTLPKGPSNYYRKFFALFAAK